MLNCRGEIGAGFDAPGFTGNTLGTEGRQNENGVVLVIFELQNVKGGFQSLLLPSYSNKPAILGS